MPKPSQEPQASSKAPNEDFKDIDVLFTLKINIESQNSEHWFIKTSVHNQVKIPVPKPSQGAQHLPKPPRRT